jgi:hypothetical protein
MSSITDLCAAFRPEYLSDVTRVIEEVIDDLEKLAPGAFHRDVTAADGKVVSLIGRRSKRKVV